MVMVLLRIVLRFFSFNSAQASSIRITQPNTMSHLHSKQEYYYHETSSSNYFCFQIAEMEEMFSKLNPMARDFVPHSPSPSSSSPQQLGYFNNFLLQTNNHLHTTSSSSSSSSSSTKTTRVNKPKQGGHGKKRMNTPRTSMAQRDDVIKRTVYVSNIDHQVTEQQLASLFVTCGQLVDCRICGADPKSVLRFAFIEFTTQEAATKALNLSGTMLGYYSVRVTPSKTAIAPVNPTLLPRSQDEMEMCAKTIYCTNIDKKITQTDIKLFFESLCGEVYRLRMLGDYHHSTRIAFVEFLMPESATAALNCSGAVLGSLPIRVSPSKTPVRPRANRHGKR